MNPSGLRFIFDSAFRDKQIHDNNFWVLWIGLSYWLLILFARNWTMKNFKVLLWTAIGLCIIGNFFGFIIYKTGTALGALNGPLITLLIYRLLYDWFKKKYNKIPASPLDTFWSSNWTLLMKDGILNFVFMLTSTLLTALCSMLTK